jgi:ABC-2 type transport system permease protein
MKRYVATSLTLIWREIETIFYSPFSYIVLLMFLLLNGYSFFISLPDSQGNVSDAIRYFLGLSWMSWLGMIFIPPIITMRLLADEKKSGSIELLMTAPVTEGQVVLAKFLGAFFFYVVLWLPSLLYIIIIKRYGAIPDNGIILSSYAGIFLLGASFIALGVFTSSLSANQIVGAITALVLNLLIFFIPLLSMAIQWTEMRRVLQQLWVLSHFEFSFSKGVVDSFHVAFYGGLTLFFLFLAVRSLEARKWR